MTRTVRQIGKADHPRPSVPDAELGVKVKGEGTRENRASATKGFWKAESIEAIEVNQLGGGQTLDDGAVLDRLGMAAKTGRIRYGSR